MSYYLARHMGIQMGRRCVLRRREFLRAIPAAAAAAGLLRWTDVMALGADELRRRNKACIVLWMQGGPSQFETFSPCPEHENGGETKAIDTSAAGVRIAENLPHLAQCMEHLAVVRSMTSREGSHGRATYLLHTGYLPIAGVKYPSLGAICASEIADKACELPAYVTIGGGRQSVGIGGGFLGVDYDPLGMRQAGRLPDNAVPSTDTPRYQQRLGLLDQLQQDYAQNGGRQVAADHRKLYQRAARMVTSPGMNAFDLEQEAPAVRDAYTQTAFGNSCLLARRLVEAGVTFVEVFHGGWDTHQDNFARCRNLTGQIDQPFAQLLRDLHDRGLLDNTLVLWMGEFGRTPRINPRTGRDHYPRAFNVALGGGGIRGGQVIGRTDPSGAEVADRPVRVQDLFATALTALGIDHTKSNLSPIGRPIKLVDDGTPVSELLG